MKKRMMTLGLAVLMLCALFATPAAAAAVPAEDAISPMYIYNDYFTGGTGTMNSMAGSQSRIFNASSGGVSDNALATNVELTVTVSRGSIPFYIVVVNPYGRQAERYITSSCTVEFDEFNDLRVEGTWQIYIYNTGSVFTDVSTATAGITVYYGYDTYA